MSVRELVLLIFWGISCILITVQIIKIRKEKARIPDKDKNSARFMGGMIVVYSIFCINHVQWDERFYNNDDSDSDSFIEDIESVQIGQKGECDEKTAFSDNI